MPGVVYTVGLLVTPVIAPAQLSVAVGDEGIYAEQSPEIVGNVAMLGTGDSESFTSTVNEHDALLHIPVPVIVTVVVPRLNVEPEPLPLPLPVVAPVI